MLGDPVNAEADPAEPDTLPVTLPTTGPEKVVAVITPETFTLSNSV